MINNMTTEVTVGALWASGAQKVVDTELSVENLGIHVMLMAGFTGSATVALEGADDDPANPGTPLGSSWAAITEQGPDDAAPVAVSLVVADTNPVFVAKGKADIAFPLHKRKRHIRAAVTGTTTNITVVAVGKARKSPAI